MKKKQLSNIYIFYIYKRGVTMFGCMPIHCGYNPKLSDAITGIQMGLAGLNGMVNIFEAKNNGADTLGAISYGLGNAYMDMSGALFGNLIDKSTHSYLGSTMNSYMQAGGIPYFGSSALFASSLMMPYSMSPYTMMPPMSFSNSYMFGMPRFGSFCCHC